MIRPLLLSVLALALLLPARAQENNPFDTAPFEAWARAQDRVAPLAAPFRTVEGAGAEAQPLGQAAPFADLPFLRLRAGDRLVRGQLFSYPYLKGAPPADATWGDPGVWLRRGDGATQLSTAPDGPLQLTNANDIAHFAWEPTRQNADALFEFWRNASGATNSPNTTHPASAQMPVARSLTLAQLRQLSALLQNDFAEYESSRLSAFVGDNPDFKPGFQNQNGTGEATSFVYAGLGFDAKDGVYQFRWTLGTQGWNEERATLIAVPLPVSASSRFQQTLPPLMRQSLPADAQQRLDAQTARLDKFYQLVKSVLDAPPTQNPA